MKKNKKIHSTNYYDTFIEVAEDTKCLQGQTPASKNDKRTIAEMQFKLISENPYTFTSDDILFQVYADRQGLTPRQYPVAREQYFSKGQACLRTSPLAKTHGFGIHANGEGKVALFGVETDAYQQFIHDPNVKKVKAMRSSAKK